MNEEKQLITDPVVSAQQNHKYLGVFGMLWVTVLIVGTLTSLKTFYIGTFIFSVGAIAYPFVYIFADIFTEVYGYRVTRKIVWTGFACMLLASMLAYIYSIISTMASLMDDSNYSSCNAGRIFFEGISGSFISWTYIRR